MALAVASSACASPAATRELVERTQVAMGSQLRLAAWTSDPAAALTTFNQVFREFERLESLMSVWRAGSDVVRMNQMAGVRPVPVSRDTIEVLRASREASEWTSGKFDVTFGALADIWKFDHDQDNIVPDRQAIDARLPLIDYAAVVVGRAAGTAFITRPGMRVHLGGIGKGYAVDRAVSLLRERGLTDFLIQSGGDMYVAGTNGDVPWTVGIQDPRGPPGHSFATLTIGDGAISTSGDYERSFVKDGNRYHHLLDPDRGEPATGTRSVTVVADRAILADVLSTGVFIMGPEAGMALVERLPDVEAVIVTTENEVLISSGLKGRVAIVAPTTDAP